MTPENEDATTTLQRPLTSGEPVRILLVVEGTNDIEFLRRISMLLNAADATLPDLAAMERRGHLIFVPFGGGQVTAWSERLSPLGKPEFHLYDHELPPETDHRRDAAETVNGREGCEAVLTRKRSLENYLHPLAIKAAGDIEVAFSDFCPVAQIVARSLHRIAPDGAPWELIPQRARNRRTHRAKRWLNTCAAERMTAELLQERDPEGEVVSWLESIARLAGLG